MAKKEVEKLDVAVSEPETPEVVEHEETAITPASQAQPLAVPPEETGFEDMSSDEIAIPFFGVIQKDSKQVEGGESPVEGAKPGMIHNSVTDELHDSVVFVPVLREHTYVEWVPRDKGGGFVAKHAPNSEVVEQAIAQAEQKFQYFTDDGNNLTETYYLYGLVVHDDGNYDYGIFSFTSTKIKVYRQIMTKLRTFTLTTPEGVKRKTALWEHKIKIGTRQEKNAKGRFFNFTSGVPAESGQLRDCLVEPGSDLYDAAVSFRDAIKSGMATAATESVSASDGGGSGPDEIPF